MCAGIVRRTWEPNMNDSQTAPASEEWPVEIKKQVFEAGLSREGTTLPCLGCQYAVRERDFEMITSIY